MRVRARAHLLDEAGKMLVAAGGGEGPGHADEDGGAVAERLCQVEVTRQVEVVCQVEPLSLSPSPSPSLSLSAVATATANQDSDSATPRPRVPCTRVWACGAP